MNRPFREHHLLQLLEGYDQSTLPIDAYISQYFRAHKSLGSHDRKYIAEMTYGMVRWKALLDTLIGSPKNWERRLKKYQKNDYQSAIDDAKIPLNIRLSFPKPLFELILSQYGEELAKEICFASNLPAPTTIRANTLKTTRDELMAKLIEKGFSVFPTEKAPNGITFEERVQFISLPEFQCGMFEMQDEGSQILGELIDAKPGQNVLDFCAGAGGKTLAFAPKMENKGQVFLHDVRSYALADAKKRLRRAGIQNAQFLDEESPHLKKLKKKMDWVLVDAPCSGTGTLRRNPDMKWKFTQEMLDRIVGQQRMIFEKALSFLKPGGTIIYATCSLLSQENQDQADHFCKTYSLEPVTSFVSIPQKKMMDGFYAIAFKFKKD